jgi:hypothetical protein
MAIKKPATVNIHGKEYVPVAARVQMAHDDLKEGLSITTEVIDKDPIVVKATVLTPKGTFTGISAANPSKTIEKQSPYEVAETSAVGRALGFAGYGIVEGIASADEMVKANPTRTPMYENGNGYSVVPAQIKSIRDLLYQKGHTEKELMIKYDVTDLKHLTGDQASTIIANLQKLPDREDEINNDEIPDLG